MRAKCATGIDVVTRVCVDSCTSTVLVCSVHVYMRPYCLSSTCGPARYTPRPVMRSCIAVLAVG